MSDSSQEVPLTRAFKDNSGTIKYAPMTRIGNWTSNNYLSGQNGSIPAFVPKLGEAAWEANPAVVPSYRGSNALNVAWAAADKRGSGDYAVILNFESPAAGRFSVRFRFPLLPG
jgi:hypothetical protein